MRTPVDKRGIIIIIIKVRVSSRLEIFCFSLEKKRRKADLPSAFDLQGRNTRTALPSLDGKYM